MSKFLALRQRYFSIYENKENGYWIVIEWNYLIGIIGCERGFSKIWKTKKGKMDGKKRGAPNGIQQKESIIKMSWWIHLDKLRPKFGIKLRPTHYYYHFIQWILLSNSIHILNISMVKMVMLQPLDCLCIRYIRFQSVILYGEEITWRNRWRIKAKRMATKIEGMKWNERERKREWERKTLFNIQVANKLLLEIIIYSCYSIVHSFL